jgi:hypothetical protein
MRSLLHAKRIDTEKLVLDFSQLSILLVSAMALILAAYLLAWS